MESEERDYENCWMHKCSEYDVDIIIINTKDTWVKSKCFQNHNQFGNTCHLDSIAKIIKRVIMAPL